MNGHRNETRKEKNNKLEDKYRKTKCLTKKSQKKKTK